MDFIHKIISERRAAKFAGSPPPAPEPELQAELAGVLDAAQDTFGQAQYEGAGAHQDDQSFDQHEQDEGALAIDEIVPQSRPGSVFTAPAWTNPLAAVVAPEIIKVGHSDQTGTFAQDASLPDLTTLPLAAFAVPTVNAPEPASSQAPEQSLAAKAFFGWDEPKPLQVSAPEPRAFTRPAAEPQPETMLEQAAEPVLPEEPPMRLAQAAIPNVPTNHLNLSEMPYVSARSPQVSNQVVTDAGVQVPPPAAGRGSNRAGHVKTRLLGFNPESLGLSSPFEKTEAKAKAESAFPVGWLAVVAGPGLGAAFSLFDGVARIGRGEDQEVCLNFGDNAISRDNHVSVAFDSEQNAFFVGQSGRSNIVRLNNKPLLSTEQIRSGDQIRIGETTLRLAALCGDEFSWSRKV